MYNRSTTAADTLNEYTILSLSPEGLQKHPELLAAYCDTPHHVYTEGEWNKAGLLDYQRDLSINGYSLTNKPLDEIERLVSRQVNGTREPSLLTEVMKTSIAGQGCEAPPLTIAANQILLMSELPYFSEKKKVFSGSKEIEVPTYSIDKHFTMPTYKRVAWKTGNGYAIKNGSLAFYFSKLSSATGLVAVKKGEDTLSHISEEEFMEWTKLGVNNDSLPFQPLLEIHFTFQLNLGRTLGTLPAVFGLYTNINYVIYKPTLLGFKHVYGLQEQPPRVQRHAHAGFIPPSTSSRAPAVIPAADTTGYSGYYGDPRIPPTLFSDLQGLDIAGSFYQLNIVSANNAPAAVEIARRSMNTADIPLLQRPTVVVEGNECGPVYLPEHANLLQQQLGTAITEKNTLESNINTLQDLHQQLIQKATDMQEQIGQTTVLGDMLKFQTIEGHPISPEWSIHQLLSAYYLLFYNPIPATRAQDLSTSLESPLSPLATHLRKHYVSASQYAKTGYRHQLKAIHAYELTQETLAGDRVSKHRLYQLTENRLLTEPYSADLHDNDKERAAAFSCLLLAIQDYGARKDITEVMIPVIFKKGEAVAFSTLISFKVSLGALQPTYSKDDALAEEGSQKPTIFLKSPAQQSSLKLFSASDRSDTVVTKETNYEQNLCGAISKLFGAQDCAITRTTVYYQQPYFSFTRALLHLIITELDQTEVVRSCKKIHAEIVPYIRRIKELPTTEFAVFTEGEESVPVERHTLLKGRPFKLIFEQLNRQIISLREGIGRQKLHLQHYDAKIATIFKAMQEICEKVRQPMEVTYPNIPENIRRQSITIVELQKKRAAVRRPINPITNDLTPLRAKKPSSAAMGLAGSTANDTPSTPSADFDRRWAESLLQELEAKMRRSLDMGQQEQVPLRTAPTP